MQAQAGDELLVKGFHVGEANRRGVIVEVHGANGQPPYLVRWSDGHESSFFPSSDAVLNGAKDSYGFGVFAAFIVPMGDGGEVAWSAAAPCR
jgi:hypothetical protein